MFSSAIIQQKSFNLVAAITLGELITDDPQTIMVVSLIDMIFCYLVLGEGENWLKNTYIVCCCLLTYM